MFNNNNNIRNVSQIFAPSFFIFILPVCYIHNQIIISISSDLKELLETESWLTLRILALFMNGSVIILDKQITYLHSMPCMHRSFPSSLRLSLYLSLSLSFSLFHFYMCIHLKIALEEYCLKMSMRLNVIHLLMPKYFLLLFCR